MLFVVCWLFVNSSCLLFGAWCQLGAVCCLLLFAFGCGLLLLVDRVCCLLMASVCSCVLLSNDVCCRVLVFVIVRC